jgi:outer membrane protein assembly factor BamA
MGTQLEYPEGLQSEISANLMLRGSAPNLTLEGNVDVLDSLYRRDIDLNEKLFERLTPQEEGFGASKTPGFTEGINLEVTVNTTGPVVVANNLAKLDLIGDFRVRGTVADPVVLGRASVLDGGEVYFGPIEGGEAAALGERRDRYIVERGTLDFNNALRTEPSIDFEATHELQARDERYLVRLRATGTPTDLRTELTSDPYLSEPDIIAMLLTGRSFADMQSARLTVAREQFLNYLSGQLTSHFFQNAGASLGLDTVTIEPVTIATDEDISARLTVGKNITNDLSLIYSQNLAGPRDQAWIVNYTTFKDFVLRGINRTDQEKLQFELRHGLEFGGGPALPRRVAPRDESRLISVAFDGATGFTNEQLMKQVGKIGDPYNIYRMNDDVRSLRTFFSSQSYPDARVRARRHAFSGMVDVRFTIDQGPRILFEYRGAGVPQKLREDVLRTWEAGSSEAASLKESIGVVLRHFRDDGFLQATVTARNESQNPDDRLYVFMIQPGTKFRKPEWRFQGIEPLDVAESSGEVLENPQRTQERIEFQLRGQGFLDARATVPELVLGNGRPYFSITVDKGVQYMVSALHYTGNSSSFTNTRLTRVVLVGPTEVITPEQAGATRPREADEPLKPFPYTSDWVSRARRRLLTEYWQEGFNDVQIGSSTDYRKGSGRIEISFQIDEGAGQKISEIQIHGDSKTLREHLNRYFQFKTGDPVDYSRINLTRKKLYDTGLFKRVEIEVSPTATGYLANVNLNERAPWSLRYGITLTDYEDNGIRDVGLSNEVTHRNIFGRGILAGLSLKADQSFREARLFTSFPVFRGKDVDTTGALFRTREMLPDSISNTWGFTVQQQRRLSDFYMLTYDYSYRRVNTVERDLTDDDPEIIDGILPVARFNVTLSRDTRDDILNATRGTFFSNSFQVAPPGVGSSVLFVRNYVQYMRFREVLRPNLIWASAYRLGLARSFGDQPMLPDDRFNLGASLRAFGPNSPAFSPGDALFVTNQELRYPLFWRFGVVAFVDLGNVYRRVSTARPLEQRVSPGIGLRIDTPFTLLRLDFGFNPSPKPGESRHRFSWGIGQAF